VKPTDLKTLLHASPFVPFSIVLANGEVHHVSNPDVLNVTLQGQVIYEDFEGPTIYINPILITEIIRPARRGQKKKRAA
jgi:hypothetical protein